MSLDASSPVLYSFRRCPYAMRARVAILASGLTVELREIVLREKAPEFLASSPKGTVPVLVTPSVVIEESLEVMLWALDQSDPESWLVMPEAGYEWIARCDGPFKTALDHTKYAVRYPDLDPEQERGRAAEFLLDLNSQIASSDWIFGATCTLADMAIVPFIRQFANSDRSRFDAQPWPNLQRWLSRFLASDRFVSIMTKYPEWQAGDRPVIFPNPP
ncbi:glutathione S-transferase [uncultured Planktomarina sp.]|uniref:glutathione S-transferase n=1 Tax=uncultured Planktomarina sp. TaxID=1538529 RepID=UPI0032610C82